MIENNDEHEAKIKRVIEIQKELELRKALYDELDKLTLELKAGGFVSTDIQGLHIELVDNFAEGKNTCFRPAGVKRFEIEVEPLEKYQKRLEKKAKKAGG